MLTQAYIKGGVLGSECNTCGLEIIILAHHVNIPVLNSFRESNILPNLADVLNKFMEEIPQSTLVEIDKLAFIYIKDKKILSSRTKGRKVWYIPGGKREKGENDVEALEREIKEELNIRLVLASLRYMGVYRAQADNHQHGVIVKMSCYYGEFEGELQPKNEIEEITYLSYSDKDKCSRVDQLIIEELYKNCVIA